MSKKPLEKLNRIELLDLLYHQEKRIEEVQMENEKLKIELLQSEPSDSSRNPEKEDGSIEELKAENARLREELKALRTQAESLIEPSVMAEPEEEKPDTVIVADGMEFVEEKLNDVQETEAPEETEEEAETEETGETVAENEEAPAEEEQFSPEDLREELADVPVDEQVDRLIGKYSELEERYAQLEKGFLTAQKINEGLVRRSEELLQINEELVRNGGKPEYHGKHRKKEK